MIMKNTILTPGEKIHVLHLGSTVERLLKEIPCSALVVRPT